MPPGRYKDFVKIKRMKPLVKPAIISKHYHCNMFYRTLLLLLIANTLFGQVINTATLDTTDFKVNGRATVEGYLDAYYAYDFNKPANNDRPYFVSMNRHNEINIILAFLDVKYSAKRVRARIVPGFGTYVNANYSKEAGTLKNLVEANAGYKLSKKKNIWVDAGVLGSPYTNESAVSKDHLAYTRSLGAENVPYYLSGVKLSVPLSDKVNSYFYVTNGWQQITDQNTGKSFGTQIEYRPNGNLLLDWNTYMGKERTISDSLTATRLFTDAFFIYKKNKWSATGCIYVGVDKTNFRDHVWWQGNIIGSCAFNSIVSASARFEYFNDDDGAVVTPVTGIKGFSSFGSSVGLNINPDPNLVFRTEARYLFSDQRVYQKDSNPADNSFTVTGGVCVWF
jgi:hypothetical protein